MKLYVLKGSHGSHSWIAYSSMNMELLTEKKRMIDDKQLDFREILGIGFINASVDNKNKILDIMRKYDPKYELEQKYKLASMVYYEIEEVEILE